MMPLFHPHLFTIQSFTIHNSLFSPIGPFLPLRLFQVGIHHHLHELIEARFQLPPQLALGLGGIAQQQVDLGRTEVSGIDPDHDLAGLRVDPLSSVPLPCHSSGMPSRSKTFSAKVRTDQVSPVAMT